MLVIILVETNDLRIAQPTVIAIIVASTLIVLTMLWLISVFVKASSPPASSGHNPGKNPENNSGDNPGNNPGNNSSDDVSPLRYGNFFVVVFALMTALIGFLLAFPLVVSDVFSDPTQVIALLSALFGTIVGLVGTYFGIKSSGDAAQKAQSIAERATPYSGGHNPDDPKSRDQKPGDQDNSRKV